MTYIVTLTWYIYEYIYSGNNSKTLYAYFLKLNHNKYLSDKPIATIEPLLQILLPAEVLEQADSEDDL